MNPKSGAEKLKGVEVAALRVLPRLQKEVSESK
jgi:hypothetical protein